MEKPVTLVNVMREYPASCGQLFVWDSNDVKTVALDMLAFLKEKGLVDQFLEYVKSTC